MTTQPADTVLVTTTTGKLCLRLICKSLTDGHTHLSTPRPSSGRKPRPLTCSYCPDCCAKRSEPRPTCLMCGIEVSANTPAHCLECGKHGCAGHVKPQKCAGCKGTIWPSQPAMRDRVASTVVWGDANAYHFRGGRTKYAANGDCWSQHLAEWGAVELTEDSWTLWPLRRGR